MIIFLYALGAGAILGLFLYITTDMLKVLLPRRYGPSIDRAVDNGMRFLGKIVALFFFGLIAFFIWLFFFSGY